MENKIYLKGEITIPPDKSISHRSLILAFLLNSKIKIKNLSLCEDCISTLKILEKLGLKYEFLSKNELILDSSNTLKSNSSNIENIELDCGNSGTTTRLLSGFFARSNYKVTLIGDESLSKRPMKRIIEPLEQMGAKITSNNNKLPMTIEGTKLKNIEYFSPIASAQVKSCLILAGLGIENVTTVYEPILSRNHTELMLKYLGADIVCSKDKKGYYTKIKKSNLNPKDIEIVGDISSAAFFMAASAIIPNSSIKIKNVGINPTRTGILNVFDTAQIDYELSNQKTLSNELCADITVNYTKNIKPFKISGDLIPRLIDEIPILALLATQAQGICEVSNAQDLRNKESDRIKTIVRSFSTLGVDIKEKEDGFIIKGKVDFNKSATLETFLDHRLAMTYYILSLINKQKLTIKGLDCINTSFPEFFNLIKQLKYEN